MPDYSNPFLQDLTGTGYEPSAPVRREAVNPTPPPNPMTGLTQRKTDLGRYRASLKDQADKLAADYGDDLFEADASSAYDPNAPKKYLKDPETGAPKLKWGNADASGTREMLALRDRAARGDTMAASELQQTEGKFKSRVKPAMDRWNRLNTELQRAQEAEDEVTQLIGGVAGVRTGMIQPPQPEQPPQAHTPGQAPRVKSSADLLAEGKRWNETGRTPEGAVVEQFGTPPAAAPAPRAPVPTTPLDLSADDGVKATADGLKRRPDGRLTPNSIVQLTRKAQIEDEVAASSNSTDTLKAGASEKAARFRQQAAEAYAQYADMPEMQKRITDMTRDPTFLEQVGNVGARVAEGFGSGLVDIAQFGGRQLFRGLNLVGADIDVNQNVFQEFTDEMKQAASDWDGVVGDIPAEVRAQMDESIVSQVASGVGSTLTFIVPTTAALRLGKLVGMSPVALSRLAAVLPGVLGAAQSGNSGREEAQALLQERVNRGEITAAEAKRGVNEAEFWNAVVGSTEVISPAGRFAKRIGGVPAGGNFLRELAKKAGDGGMKNAINWIRGAGRRYLVDVLAEAGEEGFQELLQAYAGNLVARGKVGNVAYDPTRNQGESLAQNAGIGAATGALISALLGAYGSTSADRKKRIAAAMERGRQAQAQGQPPAGEAPPVAAQPTTPPPVGGVPAQEAVPGAGSAPNIGSGDEGDGSPAPGTNEQPTTGFLFTNAAGETVTVPGDGLRDAVANLPEGFEPDMSKTRQVDLPAAPAPAGEPTLSEDGRTGPEPQGTFTGESEGTVPPTSPLPEGVAAPGAGQPTEVADSDGGTVPPAPSSIVVAQPVEQRSPKPPVAGSSPADAANPPSPPAVTQDGPAQGDQAGAVSPARPSGPEAPGAANVSAAGSEGALSEPANTAENIEGEKINREWTAFTPESGSLNIPRAEMPQVKAEHRGALTNFLKARGITSKEEMVLPGDLAPTQTEYSPAKVDKARKFTGGDRAILVSSDGHVVDGHHQWMAKLTDEPAKPMRVIRLSAPIREVLTNFKEFPSVEQSGGTKAPTGKDSLQVPAPISQPSVPSKPSKPKKAAVRVQARNTATPAQRVRFFLENSDLSSKSKAGRFVTDFTRRVSNMNRSAFEAMEVQSMSQADWDATPDLANFTPDSAAAYNPATNTLYLNRDKTKGEDIVNALVHEMGHFAEKFALGEEFTQREWEKLTDDQRRASFAQYAPQFPPLTGLVGDKRARAEWVAMQFARVVRGDTDQMPKRMADRLKAFLDDIRALLNKWIGNGKLTTKELDRRILFALEYIDRAPIGKNTEGKFVWVDAKGARHVETDDGILVSESVGIRPERTPAGGIVMVPEIRSQAQRAGTEFELAEEAATRNVAPATPKVAEPAPKPAKTKKPGNISDEADAALDDAFDGLLGTPRATASQESIPEDKLPAFIKAARALIASGIRTPEAMGKVLDEKFNKAVRKYSESLWDAFGMVDKSLRGTHDWSAIYAQLDQAEAPTAPTKPKSLAERSLDAANALRDRIVGSSQAIDWREFFAITDKAFGGTRADGTYSVKDAYDALEMAVNQMLSGQGMNLRGAMKAPLEGAINVVRNLQKVILDKIPTQTNRSEEQDAMQQFSTPPHFAYAANWVANLRADDVYLEPSAGIGGLAAFAKAAGVSKVVVNELSDRRRALLEQLGIADEVTGDNAENLHALYASEIRKGRLPQPTVVVMNPPFSNAAYSGKRGKTMIGAQHVEEALKLVPPGGRVVAIVGEGMAFGKPTFADWWKRMRATYSVRANIGVDGKNYVKYGTSFSNQLLVIDKPPAGESLVDAPVSGNVASIPELLQLLPKVRDERYAASQINQGDEQAPAQRPEREPAPQGGRNPQPDQPSTGAATGDVGGGKSEAGTQESQPSNPGGRSGVRAPAGPRDGSTQGAQDAGGGKPQSGRKPGGSGQRTGAGTRGSTDGAVGTGQPDVAIDGEDVGVSTPVAATDRPESTFSDSIFEEGYTPKKVSVKGAKPHPSPLVESAAMAAIDPPDVTYSPKLPKGAVEGGAPSLAQIESVVYAGQANEQKNPDGSRRGFFIGDGTGSGKGITSASIIADNFLRGRKKSVWLSASAGLEKQAAGDFANIGMGDMPMLPFSKVKAQKGKIPLKEGVLFGTYTTMAGDLDTNRVPPEFQAGATVRATDEAAGFTGNAVVSKVKPMRKLGGFDLDLLLPNGDTLKGVSSFAVTGVKPAANAPKSRLDQIVEWLGADYDGPIIFDEAHKAGNAIDTKGGRGVKKASKAGRAVLELQSRLPNARIIYASATGATEVSNLAFAERLGLWGKGTLFDSVTDFINTIEAAGISAMEIVARDLKAMGRYIARSLSWKDVKFGMLEHELTPDQTKLYDDLAEAWQIVMRNMNEALKTSGAENNGRAKSAAKSAFFGAQQRFFNQVLTAMHMPSVLSDAQEQFDAGNALIFQLTNTNQASQERAIDALESTDDLESLDASPRDMLLQYLEKSFPTAKWEEVQDDDGNSIWRPVTDSEGRPVEDPELVAKKQEMMDNVATLLIPDNPLDMILETFGAKNVTEVTGRNRRVVTKENAEGVEKKTIESRSKANVENEVSAFNDDRRRVLVFSKAGGTGYSYHADKRIKNQRQRVHYLVQAGWQANEAVQGLGRAHRSNQATAPVLKLARTDIPGHKRFISTIARRLAQLGALTTGERRSTGQGLFKDSDNLENQYASAAVKKLYTDAFSNQPQTTNDDAPASRNPLTWTALTEGMGFDPESFVGDGGSLVEEKIPSVPQFLNRILILPISQQRIVFNAFESALEANVELAKAMDRFDDGTQTLFVPKGGRITKIEERTAYTDPETKQETKLMEIEREYPTTFREFDAVRGLEGVRFYKNRRTGKVYAIQPMGQRTRSDGSVVKMHRRLGVVASQQESIEEKDIRTQPDPGEWAVGDTLPGYTPTKIVELPTEENGNKLVIERFGRQESHAAKGQQAQAIAQVAYVPGPSPKVIPGINERARYVERGTYDELSESQARDAWAEGQATADPMERERDFFLIGLLLPIWKRLNLETPKVFRFETDQQERYLGVKIPRGAVDKVLRNLGMADGSVQVTPEALFEQIMREGMSFPLSNGWKLARVTVGGQQRIEIIGVQPAQFDRVNEMGAINERIGFKPRFFVPTDEQAGPAVLDEVLRYAPLVGAPLGTPAASESDLDPASPAAFTFRDATSGERTDAKRWDEEVAKLYGSSIVHQELDKVAGVGAGERGGAGAGQLQGQDAQRFVKALSLAFGKRVNFYRSEDAANRGAFITPSNTNAIYINTAVNAPIEALFGHELGHSMQWQRPDLYRALSRLVLEASPVPEDYIALKREQNYARSKINQEWVNDQLGERFMDPAFWGEVAAAEARQTSQAGAGEGPTLRNVVEHALEWLSKMNRRLKNLLGRPSDRAAVAEVERITRRAAAVVAEYVRGMPEGGYEDNSAAVRAEQKTAQELAKTSDAEFSTIGTPRVKGTAQEEEVLGKVIGTLEDKRSLARRVADAVGAARDYVAREWQQSTLDAFTAVKRLEKATLGIGSDKLDASVSAYKWSRLTTSMPAVLESWLLHGTQRYQNGEMLPIKGSKGLAQIIKPLIESRKLELWEGYVAAKRASRLLEEGKEKNFGKFKNPTSGEWEWSEDKAREEIDTLLALANTHPEFETIRQEYVAFQSQVLDVAQAAGLLDPKKRALWEKSDYVPFYRIIETLDGKDSKGPGKRRGFSGQSAGIRQLKGGPQAVAIVENMFRNLETLLDASFKNIAMQRITGLADQNRELMVPIPYKAVPFRASFQETVKSLEAAGVDVESLTEQEVEEMVTFWRMRAPEGKNIVSVTRRGKPSYYRVKDPLLLRSILALSPKTYSWWMSALMAPKRALTSLVTLDPAFMAANTVRDSIQSWVIADTPLRPGIDSMAGLMKALNRNDPSLLGIMANGGGSGHYNRLREGEVRRQFQAMTRDEQATFLGSIMDSPAKVARLWKDIGRATENANRVAIYDSVLKTGGSVAEAAYQAKDIMDFSLRGDSKLLGFFLDTVPFMNARIQGLYRLGRGLANNPGQVATHGAVIVGATLALLAANWDDERYWELNEWDRDAYYHFWVAGRHVRIPKPFEVGQLFSTLPERMTEVIARTGDGALFWGRIRQMLLETFAMNPIPQAIRPIADRARNKTFTGSPIISFGDEFRPPEEQWNSYTSLMARELAQAAPDSAPEWLRSPKTVDHLIRGYFGTLGTYTMDAADALIRSAGDYPEPIERRLGDYWIAKRFLPEDDTRSTKYVEQFYELNKEIDMLARRIRTASEQGDTDTADSLVNENRDKLGYLGQVKGTAKQLAAIRRRENEVREGAGGDPAARRAELARLAAARNELARTTVQGAPNQPKPIFNPFLP